MAENPLALRGIVRALSAAVGRFLAANDTDGREFFRRTVAAQIHALAFLAAGIGGLYLLGAAWAHGSAVVFACLVYALSGGFLFQVSATYHFVHDGLGMSQKTMRFMEVLDHVAIYLFIAGTYTPIIVMNIQASWKGPLLAFIWSVATFGIIYTCVKSRLPRLLQHRMLYTVLFVLMGWTFLVKLGPILASMTAYEVATLLAGGAVYTIGAVVYAVERPALVKGWFGYHELWHLCVAAGWLFHYLLILSLVT